MIDKTQSDLPIGLARDPHRAEAEPDIPRERFTQVSGQVTIPKAIPARQRTVRATREIQDNRQDLVRDLQSQIAIGSYRIDANALAEKLLPLVR